MKKIVIILAILGLVISCEQKMSADLEAIKSEINDRQERILNEINNSNGNSSNQYYIQELYKLKSDIQQYTKNANLRGFSKNNDGVINDINNVIRKLEKGISNSSVKTSNSYNQSEQVSINAYRKGYNDGQMAFGLPSSESATVDESYMAHGYQFSKADYYVYRSGYNDGKYGRAPQY